MPVNPNNISRLVFSGGGAKGAVYPGAYAALKETGVFEGVKDIAGSSAGAFTAALLAVGMSTEEFQRDLVKLNFTELLGEPSENAWITKDGKPIYDFLRNTIKNLVLTFLKNQNLDDSHGCWTLFHDLDQNDHSPTFSDLEKLTIFWPERFKRLTVTAVVENGGTLKIFNHYDTPNVEIALACRASGALPIFLTPVEIEGQKYIDGGIHDNIPTEFFDKNDATNTYDNKFQDQTLVFAFLDGYKNDKLTTTQRIFEYFFGGSSVFKALYGSRKDEHENIELFKTLLGLIEAELNKKIELNTENAPLETLIDYAVDTVSENYNWSWIRYVWAVIVSAIVALWTYICSFFSDSTIAVPVVNAAIKEHRNSHTYLNIIRDKLKEAIPEIEKNQIELKDHAGTICGHAEKTMCHKVHILGPNKPPILFDKHFLETYAYNWIPKLFSSFRSNYRTTDKMEEGFQKLRSHYPLRTVGLSIGNLSAIDFDKANKHTRFMSARGYLDTINSISNLYLYRKYFDPDQFYSEIIKNFTEIYSEVLITSEKNPEHDSFLIQLTSKKLSDQHAYHLIKEEAESDLNSNLAFALTRAVEMRRNELSRETLFIEIGERCGIKDEAPISPITSHYSENCNLLFYNSSRKEENYNYIVLTDLITLGTGSIIG